MNIETIALAIAFASVIATGALVVYVIRRATPTEPESVVDVGVKLDQVTVSMATEQGAIAERFEQLDRKLAAVQTSVDKREGVIGEQMGHIGTQVTSIVSLFSNDRVRGNWGELSLARIFEVAGLVEGRDYRNQATDANDTRPDVIVSLPGNQTIVIDSKFPTARYLEAMETEDRDERQAVLGRPRQGTREGWKIAREEALRRPGECRICHRLCAVTGRLRDCLRGPSRSSGPTDGTKRDSCGPRQCLRSHQDRWDASR